MTADSARPWRADQPATVVPVCRPKLPDVDHLIPYLRAIDEARWYTNHGPLCRTFESRLAEHLAASSAEQVACAANATAALTAAIIALRPEPGTSCMMPAWTFAASAHAVVQAGLVPWFVDVDDQGMLVPGTAERYAAETARPLGAVLAVSPFGLPVDVSTWHAFRQRTGIPVVLDAAAAFDSVRISPIPTVVSLHATKAFGIGEGAFVACSDTDFVRAVRHRINFGFDGSREAAVPAMNAKLSEYCAAVGLAALDEWPATRTAYRRVAQDYVEAFDGIVAIRMQTGYGADWISGTTIVQTPAGRLARIEDALAEAGVGSRRWWGDGLARQRAFGTFPCTPLGATEELAATTLGLPCWPDLPSATIGDVVRIVARACAAEDE